MPTLIYAVDADDTIVETNDAWAEFARLNDAPELAESAVGQSLWAAVAGAETQLIWRDLMGRARNGHPVTVPYRCDSPSVRRDLQMTLHHRGDGTIEFASALRTSSPRETQFWPVTDQASESAVLSCSWCKRVKLDAWLEIEAAVAHAGLLQSGSSFRITHGMCENCFATASRT